MNADNPRINDRNDWNAKISAIDQIATPNVTGCLTIAKIPVSIIFIVPYGSRPCGFPFRLNVLKPTKHK